MNDENLSNIDVQHAPDYSEWLLQRANWIEAHYGLRVGRVLPIVEGWIDVNRNERSDAEIIDDIPRLVTILVNMIEKARTYMLPTETTTLFEASDLRDLSKRVDLTKRIFNKYEPNYTINELENIIRSGIAFLIDNKESLIMLGYPRHYDQESLWLDCHIGNLYPSLLPENRTPSVAKNKNSKSLITTDLKSMYNLDDINITELKDLRSILFEIRLILMNLSLRAIIDNVGDTLWSKSLELISLKVSGEQSDILLGMDRFYSNTYGMHGFALNKVNEYSIGGFGDLLSLVGHISEELSVGFYSKTKSAMGELQVESGNYFEIYKSPDRKILDNTIDCFVYNADKARNYWKILDGQISTDIQNNLSINITININVERKFASVIKDQLQDYGNFQAKNLKYGGLLPSARSQSKPDIYTAKFPTPSGFKWKELYIDIISDEDIKVRVRDIEKTYSFVDIGLFNKTKQFSTPTKAWGFLTYLATTNGVLSWRDFNMTDSKRFYNAKSRLKETRKWLRALMGLQTNPINDYDKKEKEYTCKFNLKIDETADPREFSRLEDDGFQVPMHPDETGKRPFFDANE